MEVKSKICSDCKIEKSFEHFYKDSHKKDGHRGYCNLCAKIRAKIFYNNNRETELKRSRAYALKNPEKHNEGSRKYYYKNKEKVVKYQIEYEKRKKKECPEFKLARLLRDRLKKAIKNNYKAGSAVKDLGCSIEELKNYLESKFLPGMTWENHGLWHIDHIRPLSSFNLCDKSEFETACHYKNLQPLWAKDNLKKHKKYE